MGPRAVASAPLSFLLLPGLLAACGGSSSPAPSPQPCAYSVTTSPNSFPAAGGSGTAAVTTGAACAWTAGADVGWLAIASGANGTGNGAAGFTVAANGDPAGGTGTLTVAGQAVSIQQAAAALTCAYAIAPTSASFGKDGGSGTFAVTAAPVCSWTAESSASWVLITTGAGGGNGTVSYSVARNVDTGGRSAIIRVGDQSFALAQSGDLGICRYSVTPIEFSPCMASVELTSQIEAQAECPWTAAPGAAWISVTSGTSGSGRGAVRFRVSDNYDAPRRGVVAIRWPTATAGQNLQVAQAGCRYAVSADSFSFAAAGGPGQFDVVTFSDPNTCGGATQDRCVWTAVSDAAWIAVTTGMPRSGDNPVAFTVTANDSSAPRTGSITVRDKVVRITQAGR